jgi:hypothetical protein
MGVPLKYMAEIPCEPTDWDELAEYARELAPETPKSDNEEPRRT